MSDSYLLDTQIFLWMGIQDSSLSRKAKAIIEDPSNDLFISVASVWEISIKKSIGKLKLPVPTSAFIKTLATSNGIELLNIDVDHAIGVEELERIHGDPFDRILVSQARHLTLKIISSDEIFDKYKLKRVW